MLLYRVNRLRAVGGGVVLRLCEGRFGVTRREWVLLALLQAGGPVHSSGLAERADLDKSATSKAVVTLVAKGYVQRSLRAGDHRYAELGLTASGEALVDRMMPVMKDINAAILGALSADEVVLLDALLDRLQASVNEMAEGSAPWPAADRRRGRGSVRPGRTPRRRRACSRAGRCPRSRTRPRRPPRRSRRLRACR